jgi:hypothetical protein
MPESRVLFRRLSLSLWAWRRRRQNDLAGLIGWLRRDRCSQCGSTDRYSWEGKRSPRNWLCHDCTRGWMEEA